MSPVYLFLSAWFFSSLFSCAFLYCICRCVVVWYRCAEWQTAWNTTFAERWKVSSKRRRRKKKTWKEINFLYSSVKRMRKSLIVKAEVSASQLDGVLLVNGRFRGKFSRTIAKYEIYSGLVFPSKSCVRRRVDRELWLESLLARMIKRRVFWKVLQKSSIIIPLLSRSSSPGTFPKIISNIDQFIINGTLNSDGSNWKTNFDKFSFSKLRKIHQAFQENVILCFIKHSPLAKSNIINH